jgi:hypothetical protein
MRAWLIFGVLLGAALSYWLEVWHAVVLLLGLVAWQRKKNRYLPDKILATPQEIENAKMVPLKPGVLAGIRVLGLSFFFFLRFTLNDDFSCRNCKHGGRPDDDSYSSGNGRRSDQSRAKGGGHVAQVSVDCHAKPFARFRVFFSSKCQQEFHNH